MRGKLTAIGFVAVASIIWMIPKIGMWAQIPVVPMVIRVPASASGPDAFMSNLAEAWEFTSLQTGQLAISWTGRIQHIPLTNGAAARQPSNNALGLQFNNNQTLTNFTPISLGGTNYTVTIFARVLITGNAGLNLNDSFFGTNGFVNNHQWYGGMIFRSSSALDYAVQYEDNNGSSFAIAVPVPMGAVYDFVFTTSNNANGGAGKSFLWTNGVLAGAVSAVTAPTTLPTFNFVGAGPKSLVDINGVGQSNLIQGIYIQTNYASTLANASNIHYYRTNFLTPGASP